MEISSTRMNAEFMSATWNVVRFHTATLGTHFVIFQPTHANPPVFSNLAHGSLKTKEEHTCLDVLQTKKNK